MTTRSNATNKQKPRADDDRRRDNSSSPTALIVPNQRHRGGKSIARLRKTRQAPRRLPLRKRKSDVLTNNNETEVSLYMYFLWYPRRISDTHRATLFVSLFAAIVGS